MKNQVSEEEAARLNALYPWNRLRIAGGGTEEQLRSLEVFLTVLEKSSKDNKEKINDARWRELMARYETLKKSLK